MDSLPLHPKLVHLPLALSVLVPLLSAGVLLAWFRGWFPRRVWTLVALAQVLLVGTAVLSTRTGEAEEERVEPFVGEAVLEQHEETAETFVWVAGFVLLLSLLPLLPPRERTARLLALATPAGALAVLVLGVRVGQAGGRLVYQHGAPRAYAATAATGERDVAPPRRFRHEEDEDDD